MLIKNLKTKAAAAILAGGLALSGGLAGAGALTGGSDEDAEAVLDRGIPEFPSSTDGGIALDGDIALDNDADTGPAQPAAADDDADKAKDGNPKSHGQAPDEAKPADHHGAEVSAVAQADTPAGAKNHGAAVCEIASRGKCMPDQDRGRRPADPSPAAAKSFEAQIERCDAKGDEKAAMFREDHKREQANRTHDREEACEQKFEAKQAAAESEAPADDAPAAEDTDRDTAAENHGPGQGAEHRRGGADR